MKKGLSLEGLVLMYLVPFAWALNVTSVTRSTYLMA